MLWRRGYLILLLLAILLSSCAEQPFSIDSVSLTDSVVFTTVDTLAFTQSGLALTVYSEDLQEGKEYQVRVESPSLGPSSGIYTWEKMITPQKDGNVLSLIFNDLLMPGETPLPSGEYHMEILNDEGVSAQYAWTRKTSEVLPFEDGAITLHTEGNDVQVTTAFTDDIEWFGTVSTNGRDVKISSEQPVVSVPEMGSVQVTLSYWDEKRNLLVTHRLSSHTILPTDL